MLAFVLYFKYNLSFRAVAKALPVKVSHVTVYNWIIRLSSFFNSSYFSNDYFDLIKAHADESIVSFKKKRFFVWFLVDSSSKFILSWHFSKHRDMSNVKILISKLNKPPNILVTDHMPAYSVAVDLFFKSIKHEQVSLGKNNPVESRFSLFKMFVRVKRGFKKLENIYLYVQGFCVVHNFYKLVGGDFNELISMLSRPFTTT